jgi:hypothetical protein
MSGPGDIDGEVSGDEAAWRDLIARFDASADADITDPPWPSSEDLPRPSAVGTSPVDAGPARTGPADTGPASTDVPGADPANPDAPTADAPRADLASADVVSTDPAGSADPVITRDLRGGVAGVYFPTDRTRIIRYAGSPRDYTPPDEEDEPYIPAPLPPPAKLDSIAKAAWVGVIGGPGYLLVVSLFLHMAVSATAAFIAIAAFVGGFAALVVKLGDRSRRDDDDDGAVL